MKQSGDDFMSGVVGERQFVLQKGEGQWKWTGYIRLHGKLEKHNFEIEDFVVKEGKITGRGAGFAITGSVDEESNKAVFTKSYENQ